MWKVFSLHVTLAWWMLMPIVFEAAMLLPSLIAVQVAKVITKGVISHSSVCVCLVLILLGVHLLVKLAGST